MMGIFWVGFGGALGALCRFLMVSLMGNMGMWAVLVVNGLGSGIIGWMLPAINSNMALFLAVGFCGAFTTFSTFAWDVVSLIQQGRYMVALGYMLATNGVCVGACFTAMMIRRALS